MSNITSADLENEMTLFNVAYLSAMNNLIEKIITLPTHEYREYDGHDEVIVRECVYVSDIVNLLKEEQTKKIN